MRLQSFLGELPELIIVILSEKFCVSFIEICFHLNSDFIYYFVRLCICYQGDLRRGVTSGKFFFSFYGFVKRK